jgi:AraC-like DNA-binding protein
LHQKKQLSESPIIKHTIREIIEALGDSLQSGDLHVYISHDKFEDIPFTYPFRTDNYGFLIVRKGSIKILLNLISSTVTKNEIIFVTPQTVLHLQEYSENLEIAALSFSTDFILKKTYKIIEIESFNFLVNQRIPKLKLSLKDINLFLDLFQIIKDKNSHKLFFKEEIIVNAFGLIMYYYASKFRGTYPDVEIKNTRYEELTFRFLKLLNENFKQERTVQFYADILCVTPGHLSKILKEVSGKSTSQLINEIVVMEAKIMLDNPKLTISQIAQELQFSNQSFFGKFFKKNTGISPSNYRKI